MFDKIYGTFFFETGSTSNAANIKGQRFSADGSPAGGEFPIAGFGYRDPSVAIDGDGDFVVVWEETYYNTHLPGQRYAADGSPVGNQFVIDDRFVSFLPWLILLAVYFWFWNRMQRNIAGRFGGRDFGEWHMNGDRHNAQPWDGEHHGGTDICPSR